MQNFKKIILTKPTSCEECLRTVSVFQKMFVCNNCGAFVMCKRCYDNRRPCGVCSTIGNADIIQRFKGRKTKLIATVMQLGFSVTISTNSLIRANWNLDPAIQNALALQAEEDRRHKRDQEKTKKKVELPKFQPTYINLPQLKFKDNKNNELTENYVIDPKSSNLFGECSICFDENKLVGEVCNHLFCVDCWNEYLTTSTTLSFDSFHCMQSGCSQHLSLHFILTYMNNEVIENYKKMIVRTFLEQHPSYQFCTGDGCNKVIHIIKNGKPNTKISCTCGQEFCFGCGKGKHQPATCEELRNWESMFSEESESLKAITAISKPCIKCGLMTERTKGCNHMTCPKCHAEWCWMCRGDWKDHGNKTGGFYKCTRYQNSEAKKLDEKAEKMKEETERYEYYSEKYVDFKAQIRKFHEQVHDKKKLISKTKNIKDVETLNTVCRIVEDAMKALQYSVVKCFYLPPNDMSGDLLFYRQDVLELAVFKFYLLEEAMNVKTVTDNLINNN
ncbi:RBR-type E3 ubiquitin transferase [Entamoeba marina]